jgi:hypothetical protein
VDQVATTPLLFGSDMTSLGGVIFRGSGAPNSETWPFSSCDTRTSAIDFLCEGYQSRRYGDRKRCAVTQVAQRLGQLGKALRRSLPDIG